jgi:hypothetical protein
MTLRKSALSRGILIMAAFAAMFQSGCGYRVAGGRSAALPNVKTIAVPIFKNETFRFKIEQTMTEAVIHELITRSSYRVQSNVDGSDAILNGIVTSVSSGPIVFNPSSGRTSKVMMTVGIRVQLLDVTTRQPLIGSFDLSFQEPYEVSPDAATYFPEAGPAVDRLCRAAAASIVSNITHGF